MIALAALFAFSYCNAARAAATGQAVLWLVAAPPDFTWADLSPGHAWVIVEYYDSYNDQIVRKSWGFRSKTGGAYGPGDVEDDTLNRPGEVFVRVPITPEQLNSIEGIVQEWKPIEGASSADSAYGILLKDCVTFVGAIAEAAGLLVPNRMLYPYPIAFMSALASQNSQFLAPAPNAPVPLDPDTALPMVLDYLKQFENRILRIRTLQDEMRWKRYEDSRLKQFLEERDTVERMRDIAWRSVKEHNQKAYNLADQLDAAGARGRILSATQPGDLPSHYRTAMDFPASSAYYNSCPQLLCWQSSVGGTLTASNVASQSAAPISLSIGGDWLDGTLLTLDLGPLLARTKENADLHPEEKIPPSVISVQVRNNLGQPYPLSAFSFGDRISVHWNRSGGEVSDLPSSVVVLQDNEVADLIVTFHVHEEMPTNQHQKFVLMHDDLVITEVVVDYLLMPFNQLAIDVDYLDMPSGPGNLLNNPPYHICSGPAPHLFNFTGSSTAVVREKPGKDFRRCNSWAECRPISDAPPEIGICYSFAIQGTEPKPPDFKNNTVDVDITLSVVTVLRERSPQLIVRTSRDELGLSGIRRPQPP